MTKKNFSRRDFIGLTTVGLVGMAVSSNASLFSVTGKKSGELLYNGIQLPRQWPPRLENLTREPMTVPYLENPPAVIPIDIGRQLFVDDFLISHTTLTRRYHTAEYHPDSPVLRPDKPWEIKGQPCAMAFSDGAWYDPSDRLFKLWYMAPIEKPRATCLAISQDGLQWERPGFDVVAGTNKVLDLHRDSVIVWLDHNEKNPNRRFKLWCCTYANVTKGQTHLTMFVSPDGIHWTEVAKSPKILDRTTVFYNPFRKVWVYSLKSNYPGLGRSRDYREHHDAITGTNWNTDEVFKWTCADNLDPHNPNPQLAQIEPELYNLDAVGYESIMLGMFSIWQGDPKDKGKPGVPKRNEVLLGYSRDGFHWHRPDRRPFAGVNETEGAWNWGNVQSVGGCCLVVGDKLYFYVSGRGRQDDKRSNFLSTGLAILRRDGFASMDAGNEQGSLTTRSIRFKGKHLFVNATTPKGELLVEVLDSKGQVIEPFSLANCLPIVTDKTLVAVKWKGSNDMAAISGKNVKFRFFLRNGSLYAFWVSPEVTGASHGYVAAGGPGFTKSTDNMGITAYTV